MPTTPRLLLKGSTVKIGEKAARMIRTEVLDTKPGSALRPRLEAMLTARQNLMGYAAAKYYTGMLRAVGEVLEDPRLPPYDNEQRPRVLSRPTRMSVRGQTLDYAPVFKKVPTIKGTGARAGLVRVVTRDTHDYQPALKLISRIPVTERVLLQSGREHPMAWIGLSPDYMRADGPHYSYLPISTTFWKKTGLLTSLYQAWLTRNSPRLSNPNAYIKSGRVIYPDTAKTGSRPRLAHLTYTIDHPPLLMTMGAETADLLRTSYVTGIPQHVKIPKRTLVSRRYMKKYWEVGHRVGLNRLVLPEFNRPLLARYAAAAGRLELATLRKLLKPLA